uniref:Uncharacterized protein n=1 Tax=Arundo donax TaxID=35708 RepID=A0A0A8Y2N6_ARUDO
MSLVSCSNRQG